MKKLISILLIISLTAAIFAGCGNRADRMNTLKSNIAAVHTPDGRVGTAIVLDDGKLIVPFHLVDLTDIYGQEKDRSFRIIYSDGSEAQAELISNDAYSDVAILTTSTESESAAQTGVSTNSFKAPKADTELFVVGVNGAGEIEEIPVSLVKSVEKDETAALVIESSSLENDQYSGAPIVDADGNIYGLFMAGTDEGMGVGVSGESIQTVVDTLNQRTEPVLSSANDSRSNIISDVLEEEFAISSEEANKILYGSRWLSASADVSDVHFSVDQTAGSLIRLKYECLNTDPLFTYELGKDGNAVAVCYTGDNEYHYDFPRTYIRGGDRGEILLHFIELEKTVGTDSIKALAIKSQREENDAEIILNFDKSFSTDLINAEESSESIGSESESGSETESGSAAAAKALKNFLIENDDISNVIIDDLNSDDLIDMIYTVKKENTSFSPALISIYTHILIYDNGQLVEPQGVSYDLGQKKEFSQYNCAIFYGTGRAWEGGSDALCMLEGKLRVYCCQAFTGRKTLDTYEYLDGDLVMTESISGEYINGVVNGTYQKVDEGPTDALIKEKVENSDWVYTNYTYDINDIAGIDVETNTNLLTVEEAIAYLDNIIGMDKNGSSSMTEEELINMLNGEELFESTLGNYDITDYVFKNSSLLMPKDSPFRHGSFDSNDIESVEELLLNSLAALGGKFLDLSLYDINREDGGNTDRILISDFEWLLRNILNINDTDIEDIKQDISDDKLNNDYQSLDITGQYLEVYTGPGSAYSGNKYEKMEVDSASVAGDRYDVSVTYTFVSDSNNSDKETVKVDYQLKKKTVDGKDYWTFLSFNIE
ncbi:MAG: trypsin-like peptidase domain-containing protein [Lachnospiraceae bacterium]|nr:trypsin-like peptidase domain-containing protein [Lachnospiraceae bacterium]